MTMNEHPDAVAIAKKICAFYDVDIEDVRGSERSPKLQAVRCAIAYELLSARYKTSIISMLINKSEATVQSAAQQYEARCATAGLPMYLVAGGAAEPVAQEAGGQQDAENVEPVNELDSWVLHHTTWDTTKLFVAEASPELKRAVFCDAYGEIDISLSELCAAFGISEPEGAHWLAADPGRDVVPSTPLPSAAAEAKPETCEIPEHAQTQPVSDNKESSSSSEDIAITGTSPTVEDIRRAIGSMTMTKKGSEQAGNDCTTTILPSFLVFNRTPGPTRDLLVQVLLDVYDNREKLPKKPRRRVERLMKEIVDAWAQSENMFCKVERE